jgi:glycosyltransferase involved in cell wall biosynthesis
MTITEAAACGTPAVATRIAGHVDAVQEGRTGLLADDAVGLVRHLDDLLSDDALRTRLGAEALTVARTRTWDETARQMLAVLSGAVAAASKP